MDYRFFAFWDNTNKQDPSNSEQTKQNLVISTHRIIKKTGKIPKSEILKAQNLRTI
jgi:hypothetical protein